jgi:hypothetical protein
VPPKEKRKKAPEKQAERLLFPPSLFGEAAVGVLAEALSGQFPHSAIPLPNIRKEQLYSAPNSSDQPVNE